MSQNEHDDDLVQPEKVNRQTIVIDPRSIGAVETDAIRRTISVDPNSMPTGNILGNIAPPSHSPPVPQAQQVQHIPVVHRQPPSNTFQYRSLGRPPMGMLTALDDGSAEVGEVWRVRVPRFLIGRARGNCIIPHDAGMSGEHAAIKCIQENDEYRWELVDLKSTNGLFIRVRRAVLRNGRELLIGGGRYLYQNVGRLVNVSFTQSGETAVAQNMIPNFKGQVCPQLAGNTVSGDNSFMLSGQHSIFGSGAHCDHIVENDPFLDAEHCQIYKDNKNRWIIEDTSSLNGIWAKTKRAPLDSRSQFQLGGQRFLFNIL